MLSFVCTVYIIKIIIINVIEPTFDNQMISHKKYGSRISLFLIAIYLFTVALGLCCFSLAFSSCGEQGLFFVALKGHAGIRSCNMGAQ